MTIYVLKNRQETNVLTGYDQLCEQLDRASQ